MLPPIRWTLTERMQAALILGTVAVMTSAMKLKLPKPKIKKLTLRKRSLKSELTKSFKGRKGWGL